MQSGIRNSLLALFSKAGNEYVSGQKISEELGCSRTAVWKHVESLRSEGYELEAVRKLGYRIVAKPDKISENEIRLGLDTDFLGQTIHYKDVLPSTNVKALQLAAEGAGEGTLVVTDEQTSGRGRMNRAWHSPSGKGIWMSFILIPDIPVVKTPQLTLIAAVAVSQALEEESRLQVQIKWPNDILCNGKKIVGILTELQADADRVSSVIIGIGINVNQNESDFPAELQSIASSLSIEQKTTFDRARIIQAILKKFEDRYLEFLSHGFKIIKPLWESYAAITGKEISARTLQGVFTGKSLGIDDEGVLLLLTNDGDIKKIYSADIDLHSS